MGATPHSLAKEASLLRASGGSTSRISEPTSENSEKRKSHFQERFFYALRRMQEIHSTDATLETFCDRASFIYPFFGFRGG